MCSIDGGASTACSSPVTFNLPNGTHTISVIAVDPAGNHSAPSTYTWTVGGSSGSTGGSSSSGSGSDPPSATPSPAADAAANDPSQDGSDPGGTADLTAAAASLTLQCSDRPLVLTNAVSIGGHVLLEGVAAKQFVGKKITIVFGPHSRLVSRTFVRPNGTFSTTVPQPPANVRRTNQARYQAVLGSTRSLSLKLFRRMLITRVRVHNGTATISGAVIRPLANPSLPIVLSRRVDCRHDVVVKRLKPGPNGSFQATVTAANGVQAGVYRLQTKVPKTPGSHHVSPTYTLPQVIQFR
jgi:hypothetical protein